MDLDGVFEYGLIGCFNSTVMSKDDEIAIITSSGEIHNKLLDNNSGSDNEIINENDSDNISASSTPMLEGLSYIEVQLYADQLSAQLLHRFGVRAGDPVLIVCESFTPAEIIACVACIRINAPFVPIDPTWLNNSEKLQYIVRDVFAVAAVIMGTTYDTNETASKLSKAGLYRCAIVGSDGSLSCIEASSNDIRDDLPELTEKFYDNDDCPPMYILYTSGSTGVPKGVRGTHKGFINRMIWQFNTIPWSSTNTEIVVRRTPLVFVDAIVEIIGSLMFGIPIWLPPKDLVETGDIPSIARLADNIGATRITMLPSQLYAALSYSTEPLGELWKSLEVVVVSGEECTASLVQKFAAVVPSSALINLYGSTEVAGDVTYSILCNGCKYDESSSESLLDSMAACPLIIKDKYAGKKVSIGVPIDHNELYIVQELHPNDIESYLPADYDTNLLPNQEVFMFEIVPDDVPGELIVGGAHVAQGYHNKTIQHTRSSGFLFSMETVTLAEGSKTILVFKSFPQSSITSSNRNAKYFRTGDIVMKCSETNCIFWIGRKDNQIKLRGVRIELEEMEHMIKKVLHDKTNCNQSYDNKIVAVVASRNHIHQNSNKDMDDNDTSNDFNTIIVVFVEPIVLEMAELANAQSLLSYLTEHMSPSHIPHLVLPISQIPLFPNGKINRISLKQSLVDMLEVKNDKYSFLNVAAQDNHISSTVDSNTIIQKLCDIYCSVIPSLLVVNNTADQKLSYEQNFYVLGGDSMTAIETIWRIKQVFQIDLPVHVMRESIAEVARRISLCVLGEECSENDISDPSLDALSDAPVAKKTKIELSSLMNYPARGTVLPIGSIKTKWIGRSGTGNMESGVVLTQTIDNTIEHTTFSLSLKWKYTFLKCVDASPLLVSYSFDSSVDDRYMKSVYIGSHNGDLAAIDAQTGTQRWNCNVGAICKTSKQCHIEGAVVCDPTGSLIFVPTYFAYDVDGHREDTGGREFEDDPVSSLGILWALNAIDGSVVWSSEGIIEGELKGSPMVNIGHDTVLVGSYDSHTYCFDTHTGTYFGKYYCGPGAIFASPVLCDIDNNDNSEVSMVITASNLGVLQCTKVSKQLANSCQFEVIWRIEVNTPIFAIPQIIQNFCSTNEEMLLCAAVDGSISLIHTRDGSTHKKIDSAASRPIFSTPCVYKDDSFGFNILFGSHDGYIRSINSGTCIVDWEENMQSVIFASPFCFSDNLNSEIKNYAAIATTSGEILVINIRDGASSSRVICRYRVPGEIYSSPVIDDNGRIYVGCRDDSIYCLSIDMNS